MTRLLISLPDTVAVAGSMMVRNSRSQGAFSVFDTQAVSRGRLARRDW